MSDWRSMVVLQDGEQLKHTGSRSKGFMAETDIDTYEIMDSQGTIVGSVTIEDHTAVRGFKRTMSLEQRDAAGAVIKFESWTV